MMFFIYTFLSNQLKKYPFFFLQNIIHFINILHVNKHGSLPKLVGNIRSSVELVCEIYLPQAGEGDTHTNRNIKCISNLHVKKFNYSWYRNIEYYLVYIITIF